MGDRLNRMNLKNRLRGAGILGPADVYREEVRQRLAKEAGTSKGPGSRDRDAVNMASWEEMWRVFGPAVEKFEKAKSQDYQQLAGLPDRTTNEILDPEYHERDRGKQLRDGLLWVALEFDRIIEDTADSGPVAHLEDASVPPPNAFAIATLRTYALSSIEKRRELIARALAFADKTHEDTGGGGEDGGAFLHTLE